MRCFRFSLCFIFTLLLVISLAAGIATLQYTLRQQGAMAQTTAPARNYLTYDNPTFGIKMQYPSDWRIGGKNVSKNVNLDINFLSPRENSSDPVKRADFDITVMNYTVFAPGFHGQIQLKDLVKKLGKSDKKDYPGFNLTEFTPTTIAGNEAYKKAFTWVDEFGDHLKHMVVYTVKNNYIYTIQYSTSIVKYPRYLPTVQNMIKSFEINKPEMKNMFLSYVNSFYGLRMLFPYNWIVQEHNHTAGYNFIPVVRFNSPLESNLDNFSENVAIDVLDSQNMSMSEFERYSINGLQQHFSHFIVIGLGRTNNILGSNPAYTFLGTFEDPRYGLLKVMETGTIIGDKAYYIRYYAAAPTFTNYLPAVQRIINSLKIEQQQNSIFLTYTNPAFGLKIKYPPNWGLIYSNLTSGQSGSAADFIIPAENVSDISSGRVNVHVLIPHLQIDPAKFTNIYLDSQRGTKKDFEVINSNDNTTLGGNNPAHMIEYTYTSENSTKTIKAMSIYTIKNNKVYTIDFYAPPGQPDKYYHLLPIVRQMVNSFQIANYNNEPSLLHHNIPLTH